MHKSLKESTWKQFGASIKYLENAIEFCPPHLWDNERRIWYSVFHCLFFLDYYLTLDPSKFKPPEPFTLSEMNPEGEMPPKVYSKKELLDYLQYGREKCRKLILSMDSDLAISTWNNKSKKYTVFEIVLYNMRHVQHHVAQLNTWFRIDVNDAPRWVGKAEIDLFD